jgi:large subunit ribosomal protein L21
MYAIVDIAGQQFKVEKDQKLYVHRLEGEEGKKVTFDQVLLIDHDSRVSVGNPVLKGAAVSAKILAHVKGDKVLVFKKKKRKGYKKLNGHRQYLTQIQVESITEKAAPQPKAAPEAEEKTEAVAKPATREEATARKETTVKKEAAAKKEAATKKEAAAPGKSAPAASKTTATKKPAAKSAAKKESKK